MAKDLILKYTPQTNLRSLLLLTAMSIMAYFTEHVQHRHYQDAALTLVLGACVILLRELISNGDHFNEFKKYLIATYDILTPDKETEDSECDLEGYQ